MAAAAPLAIWFVVFLLLRKSLLLQKRLAIGDWNLVVIRMNFGKSEEAVTIAAIIDERGLKRRFDPRHFREVDIAPQRPFACRLEVELFDPITPEHHHPGFFRVRGVDDHFVCHEELSCGARKDPLTAEKAVQSSRARRLCWR